MISNWSFKSWCARISSGSRATQCNRCACCKNIGKAELTTNRRLFPRFTSGNICVNHSWFKRPVWSSRKPPFCDSETAARVNHVRSVSNKSDRQSLIIATRSLLNQQDPSATNLHLHIWHIWSQWTYITLRHKLIVRGQYQSDRIAADLGSAHTAIWNLNLDH